MSEWKYFFIFWERRFDTSDYISGFYGGKYIRVEYRRKHKNAN